MSESSPSVGMFDVGSTGAVRLLLIAVAMLMTNGCAGASSRTVAAGQTVEAILTPTPTAALMSTAPPRTTTAPSPTSPAKICSTTGTGTSGAFVPTDSMTIDRTGHTAALLRDGRVLIAGGGSRGWGGMGDSQASAEIYDPTTECFEKAASMTTPRSNHTATPLPDGRILITGGYQKVGGVLASAELYDPKSDTFTPTGSMNVPRAWHTATRLSDGRVLIAGGTQDLQLGRDGDVALAEIYEPGAGTFSPTGSMAIRRESHCATLLADGRVLVAGGSVDAAAELYDPKTGRFSRSGVLAAGFRFETTATRLPNGEVLLVGGFADGAPTDIAELFDPRTGAFSRTGPLPTALVGQSSALLPDGRVLVVGWGDGMGKVYDLPAVTYDSAAGTFSLTGTRNVAGDYTTATALSDGRVLIAGGEGDSYLTTDRAELFIP